jgi:hypothetical protein
VAVSERVNTDSAGREYASDGSEPRTHPHTDQVQHGCSGHRRRFSLLGIATRRTVAAIPASQRKNLREVQGLTATALVDLCSAAEPIGKHNG